MNQVQQEIIRTLMCGDYTTGGIAAAYIMNCRQAELRAVKQLIDQTGAFCIVQNPEVGNEGQRMMRCEYVVAKRDLKLFLAAGWTQLSLQNLETPFGAIEVVFASVNA